MLKFIVASVAIVTWIGLSVEDLSKAEKRIISQEEDKLIESVSPMNRSSEGDLFAIITKKAGKFPSPRKINFEFNITLGDKRLNFVNFTTPFSKQNANIISNVSFDEHSILAFFSIYNYAEYRIDATVFVEP